MTELEDPSGQIVHYQYQSQAGWNGVLSALDRNGALATTFTYNASGDVTSSTDALGNVTQMTYDSLGRLSARTDARSHTTHYSYDAADRLTAITDPTNGTTQMQYDAAGNLTQTIEPLGATTIMTYDGGGRIRTRKDPSGAITTYDYDALGRLITRTDPLGHAQHTSYDLAGHPLTMTDPLGHVTRYGYDLLGNITASTDANGHVTQTRYDALSRPLTVTDATGQITRYGYDAAGNLTSLTDARGFTLHATYNALNHPLTQSDALGRTTISTYNPLGLLATRDNGTGMITRYTYDALARITQISVNDQPGAPVANDINLRTTYTYDAVGNIHSSTDPRGAVTTYSYTDRDQLGSVLDALAQTTQYGYDAAGNLTRVTDPRGSATSYAYDLSRRLTSVTDPSQHARQFSYDAAGNLHTRTSAAGAVTAFSYDAANQLIGIDEPAGTADATFTYDPVGNQLTSSDGLGTTSYTYDPLDRLVTWARAGRTLTYSYLPTGQISALDYWGHGAVQYGYDAAGQVASLTPWGAAPTSYTSRANGQIAGQTRPNGVQTTYGYDGADRLISLLHATGTTTLQPIQYMLDKNGNRIQVVDQDGTTTYQYDLLNRLISAGYPAISGGPAAATISYTYDADGNRLTQTASLPTAPLSWAYDLSNRISTPGYQYDADGNLLSDGATQYSYNAANQLIQTITSGVTTQYGYDGNGNLIRSSSAGVTTDYVLDEHAALTQVVGEIRSDGTERRYAYGPEGLSAQQDQTGSSAAPVTYPLLDGQGTLRALTDASGTLTLQQRFDAFGVLRQRTGSGRSGLGYTGELTNPTDATVYLRARHDQPQLGRFLQQDTVGGFAPRPSSLNRYTYAENNPASFTDPSGQFLGPLDLLWDLNDLGNGIQRLIRRNLLRSCGQLADDLLDVGFALLAVHMDVDALGAEAHAAAAETRLARSEEDAAETETRLARSEEEAERDLGDCMNSFRADTPVATANGETPIGDIKAGDHVLGYNQATGTTDPYTVTDVLIHTDPVQIHLTIAGERIDTTPEHPFFVLLRGWVGAGDLHVGDHVRKADGGYGAVDAVQLEVRTQRMYNLTVATAHTFFVGAGRWLVHNTNPYCGDLITTNTVDPDADALAARIGGKARIKFANDPAGREFDAINDDYIGQAKPAGFKLNKNFRSQAKATFDAAIATGRTPYFHFNGPPELSVIRKLEEYGERYGIVPIIDIIPF